MIEINYDTALSALNDAVAANGHDYVYEKGQFEVEGIWGDVEMKPLCAYLHPDSEGNLTVPGCIVGVVLHNLGVPKEDIARYNLGPTASVISERLEEDGIARVTGKARSLLGWAQGRQDHETPWGEAVADAVEHVSSFTWSEDEAEITIKSLVHS